MVRVDLQKRQFFLEAERGRSPRRRPPGTGFGLILRGGPGGGVFYGPGKYGHVTNVPHTLFRRQKPQPESLQVDVLALVGFLGAAAVDGEPQVGPQAQRLTGVVVAVRVGVAFQQPAPDAGRSR